MRTYPVCLVGLESKRSVIIGGGRVAARKTQSLLEAGASITGISPQFCSEFLSIVENSSDIEIIHRPYQAGDLAGAFLVIAATDTPEVNQSVYEEALREGCLINVVDDPAHSNFILPAVVERGPLKIAVTTGGASPALARRLRERLEALVGPEYGALADLLGELRPELQSRYDSGEARLAAALKLVDSDLLEVLRDQDQGLPAARRRAQELLLNERGSES